jgi:hypothetical protein
VSNLLVLYTDARRDLLTSLRPAWAIQALGNGFAYYREDQNTPWIKLDSSGTLDTSDIPLALLECATIFKEIKIAMILLKNRESVKDAILRGSNFSVVEGARNLVVDQALSSEQIIRLLRK